MNTFSGNFVFSFAASLCDLRTVYFQDLAPLHLSNVEGRPSFTVSHGLPRLRLLLPAPRIRTSLYRPSALSNFQTFAYLDQCGSMQHLKDRMEAHRAYLRNTASGNRPFVITNQMLCASQRCGCRPIRFFLPVVYGR